MDGLERHHAPVTSAFPSGLEPGDTNRFELSADQQREFDRDGFLFGIDVLETNQVETMRDKLDEIGQHLESHRELLYEVEQAWVERPDEVVLHFLGAWRIDEWFHDLIFHPGVTIPLAQLLGCKRLRFWHDQVFWKPARHPGIVPWHQDYSYWTRTHPARHITMFIALDDMTPENGGLHYIAGSHLWELLPTAPFGGSMDGALTTLNRERRTRCEHPTPVILEKGQASIHHSHTLHGSYGNPTESPRRAVVLNYMHPKTRCSQAGSLLNGTTHFERDDVVQGPFYPIVLDLMPPDSTGLDPS